MKKSFKILLRKKDWEELWPPDGRQDGASTWLGPRKLLGSQRTVQEWSLGVLRSEKAARGPRRARREQQGERDIPPPFPPAGPRLLVLKSPKPHSHSFPGRPKSVNAVVRTPTALSMRILHPYLCPSETPAAGVMEGK